MIRLVLRVLVTIVLAVIGLIALALSGYIVSVSFLWRRGRDRGERRAAGTVSA